MHVNISWESVFISLLALVTSYSDFADEILIISREEDQKNNKSSESGVIGTLLEIKNQK